MAFSGLARLREAAIAMRQLQRGRVRMISETVYAEGFVPRLAAAFHKDHPEVHIELDIGPSARIADWIAETWYDLGLVILPVPHADVFSHLLRRQRALCAVPPGHRLAGRRVLHIEELASERFVAPVENTPFRIFFDRALKMAGIEPDIRVVARTQHGICALVAAGAGIALVDPCVADDMRATNAVFIPCEPPVTWDIGLITPKARSPSLVCRRFTEHLIKHART
jgi:DNA-binding transcriptional LysR family regulator